MTTGTTRRKHLLDPEHPRPRRDDPMSLSSVQTWVLSALAVTTILHLSAGLTVAAAFVGDARAGARVGLLVIAGLFGVAAVGAGLAIHRHRLLSWWLLLGWVPAAIGACLIAKY
jgi:hypothetical protein